MDYAQNTIGFILFSIIGFYILMIVYFTVEHRLTRCVVKVPEYRAEHAADCMHDALDWIAQYPKGTECLILRNDKVIASRI